MRFDFASLPAPDRYKLMVSTIVPRPIAWVVTKDAEGVTNAAPYSLFNMVSDDPPVLAFSSGPSPATGTRKDTARNVLATRRFTVCLVPEAAAAQMNVTAADLPPEVDELALAGLTELPFGDGAPRIGESPVAFDCELFRAVEIGKHLLVLGRVLAMEIRDDCVLDAARRHVDTPRLGLIGRMGGGGYVRLTDRLEMPRLTPEQAMALARR
ncbi:MAG: flavin reductase family protein [Acetobacteraceae bacterium]|nr:flavin reductase family protein [Acetobacteraceae bacterium]